MKRHTRKGCRKLTAGILGMCMLLGCTISGFPAYAAEEAGSSSNTGIVDTDQGAANKNSTDNQAAGQDGAGAAAGQGEANVASGQGSASGTAGQGDANQAAGQGSASGTAGQGDANQAAGQGSASGTAGQGDANQAAGQTNNGDASGNQGSNKDLSAMERAHKGTGHNQIEKKENSWRYYDGKLLVSAQSTFSLPSPRSYPNAWEKVNGVYVNNYGDPIKGAVKKGIDVSEHQGKIDWNKVKNAGIDYALLRCGYGDDVPGTGKDGQDDIYWAYNVSECERLGIPYGVYIYSYATNVAMAESEAYHVLRLIKGHSFTYPVYFDMEDKTTVNTSEDMKGQMAQKFTDIISAAGYPVGIYANLNWFQKHLTSPVFGNPNWSKWVAQYNSTCDYEKPYDMWQYTDVGKVDGIKGNVDTNFLMDTYKGSGSDSDSGGSGNPSDSGGNPSDSGGNPSDSGSNPSDSGNGGTTLAVRRGNQYHIKYSLSNGPADLVVNYGYADDTVLVGDWDGDGVDTLCVRRGNTYYFKNSLSSGNADTVVKYGRASDEVLVGDWDGDGVDSLCVRRGNTYYIKNSLADGEADKVVKYGRAGDIVMTGDWDKDGVDTLCVRRGHTYYIKNSLADGPADSTISYGRASDDILVGDWDGDGADTLCVRRGNEYHIKNTIQNGNADIIINYGRKDDITYAGKWQ